MDWFFRRLIRWFIHNYGAFYTETLDSYKSDFHIRSFLKLVTNTGEHCLVHEPYYIINPQYITIGNNFYAGPGLRIEAWDKYQDFIYKPNVIIGNNVVLNHHVHIGSIDRVVLGDYCLIGSNVLITDHSHGDITHAKSDTPFLLRPLCSKGPTILGKNVWVGEGACILSGVEIGDGAIIGANAVVTHNVPSGSIVGGVPARLLQTKV